MVVVHQVMQCSRSDADFKPGHGQKVFAASEGENHLERYCALICKAVLSCVFQNELKIISFMLLNNSLFTARALWQNIKNKKYSSTTFVECKSKSYQDTETNF